MTEQPVATLPATTVNAMLVEMENQRSIFATRAVTLAGEKEAVFQELVARTRERDEALDRVAKLEQELAARSDGHGKVTSLKPAGGDPQPA